MIQASTALIEHCQGWWIGWVEEINGVNCQEKTKEALMESLSVTLNEALASDSMRPEYRRGDFGEMVRGKYVDWLKREPISFELTHPVTIDFREVHDYDKSD